jgi:7-cyano-7-deazaguanine synthase
MVASAHTTQEQSACIVLLSGGQDSTTCLWMAKLRFEKVVAVSFNYGQKHAVELQQAQEIAKIAGVSQHKIFDIRGLLSGSAQTDHSLDVNAAHARNSSLPATFTAGRNALFLTLAAAYGHEYGISDIYTGVCETDYSGYPDCRREFVDAQQYALRLALDNSYLTIHTPLMKLDKAGIWKAAVDLGCFDVVRNLTLTDYNGNMTMNVWGMGGLNNPASELRAKGFLAAFEKGWIPEEKLLTWREPEFRAGWDVNGEVADLKHSIQMYDFIKESRELGISDDQPYMQSTYVLSRMNGDTSTVAMNSARESERAHKANPDLQIFNMSEMFGGPEIHNVLSEALGESKSAGYDTPDCFTGMSQRDHDEYNAKYFPKKERNDFEEANENADDDSMEDFDGSNPNFPECDPRC